MRYFSSTGDILLFYSHDILKCQIVLFYFEGANLVFQPYVVLSKVSGLVGGLRHTDCPCLSPGTCNSV